MVTYPSEWKECSLNDVIKIKRGASPRPIESYLTFSSSGVRWIKIGDAPRDGKYIVSTAEEITKEGANHSVRVYPGDFILSNSMSFGRPYLLGVDGCIHDGWLRLYDFQNEVDKDFLYYLLSSPSVKGQYESFAAGSGVQNLNKEVVKKVQVFLPKLSEQQAIASALSDFDEHIDNLSELIEKKKAIRDGALEDLLSGRTRLDGFNGEWEEKSFKDLGDILTGLTYSPDNIRPSGKLVIRSSNVQDDRLSFEDNVFVDRTCVISEDIKKGDIILCVRNGSASLIGKSAYANSDLDATFGAFMSNFRCKNHDSSGFVYYFTKSVMFKKFVKQILGATINQITKTDLKRVTLKIPVDIEEQQAITQVLTAMDEEIESLKIEKEKMIQIKEGAMDDLLTGRVRLKV